MSPSPSLPERRWLPEGFRRLQDGVAGGARYTLGPAGSGRPTVVLLPGIEGDARTFCRMVELGGVFPVQAHDLPPTGAADVAGLAAAMEADLPLGHVVLVGCSLGGLVARCLGERWPQRVRGVVSIGSLPSGELLPRGIALRARLSWRVPDRVFSHLYRRRIRGLMDEESVPPELTAHLLEGLPPAWLHRARMSAIGGWGVPEGCAVPTLSLRGQFDREAPWRGADVARALPGSGFETIPGGHRPQLTHPEPLVALLRRFVESLRGD